MKKVALQLYSLQDETARDFYGSLKKVAEAGYTGVEFAGYGNVPADEMRSWLQEFGLEAISTHTNVLGNLEQEISYCQTLGMKHLVLPWAGFESRDAILALAEAMNRAGKKCLEEGLTLSYHNHSHEFRRNEEGELWLDFFLANTDPSYVKLQLDVCWATVGGVDPVSYLRQYQNRSLLVHCKEVKTVEPYEGTAVGDGLVDFAGIYGLLGDQCQYIVEQEHLSIDRWEALRKSADFLHRL